MEKNLKKNINIKYKTESFAVHLEYCKTTTLQLKIFKKRKAP